MTLRNALDANPEGQRVLIRVDFNVTLHADGSIDDDTRIRRALPLIKYLRKQRAIIILMTHLGRPKKKETKLRTRTLAARLSELLRVDVSYINACIGSRVEHKVNRLQPGDILMLENLRFYPQEEQNDPAFAKGLAKLADIYVNEAFSNSHRSHASMVGVPKHVPAYAGPQLVAEINTLTGLLHKPRRPFVAMLGGAKVKSKIEAIMTLCERASHVLIGGAMMFTFLAARGKEIGASKVETEKIPLAKSLLKKYGHKIILPVDVVVSKEGGRAKTVSVDDIPQDWAGLDIGAKSVDLFQSYIKKAKSVFWNGPMGLYEDARFAKGTESLARALAAAKAFTVVGGGDSVDVINNLHLAKKFDFVSTGGGASLDVMAGKKLPAVIALEQNAKRFKQG